VAIKIALARDRVEAISYEIETTTEDENRERFGDLERANALMEA